MIPARAVTAATSKNPPLFQEPIHILGAGAIGMLWAASIRCAFPNYPVKLLMRDNNNNNQHKESLRTTTKNPKLLSICLRQFHFGGGDVPPSLQQGLKQKRRGGSPRTVHVPCEIVTSTATTSTTTTSAAVMHAASRTWTTATTIRNLIVTTKAASAVSAVQSVRHRIDIDTTRIILLCNGAMAVRDELTHMLQQQQLVNAASNSSHSHSARMRVHLALTTHGVYREAASDDDDDDMHHVVHAGYGNTVLQGLEPMAALWDMVGLNCKHVSTDSDEMQRLMWNKLAANCVINPLTALHNCLNGEIRKLPQFENYYYPALLSEIAQVCVAATAADGATTTTNGTMSNRSAVEADFREYVDGVIRDTAHNRSSMLQDVAAHRDTEVDYLSGYVVRVGAAHGISCPVHDELWQAVHSLRHHHQQQ